MEQINYENLLPQKPVTDVVAYALENGAFQKSYLVYRSDRVYEPLEDQFQDAVSVACSACGHTFYAEKVQACGCSGGYPSAPFGWRNERMVDSVISGKW